MPAPSDDNLFSEEFDIDDIDASSLHALFSGQTGSDETPAGSNDQLIDLTDDEDLRPGPTFGTLAEDVDDGGARPLLSDADVFEPMSPGDTPRDDVDLPPIPSSREEIVPEETAYELDDPEERTRKLSMKERLALARQEASSPTKPAAKKKPEPKVAIDLDTTVAPSDASASGEGAVVDVGGQKKLSLKERLALAREEVGRGKKKAPVDAGDDIPTGPPVTIDLDTTPQPDAPTGPKKKLSLKERLALAREEATSSSKKNEGASEKDGQADENVTPLDIDLHDSKESAGEDAPAKLSLRERLELAKSQLKPTDDTEAAASTGSGKEQSGSPLARVQAMWAEKKAYAAQAQPATGPGPAGLDVSAPGRWDKLRSNMKATPSASAPQSKFAELLTPLPPAELRMLQLELQADVPVFQRYEQASKTAQAQQWVAIFVTLVVLALFCKAVDLSVYFKTTLPNLPQPNWVPDALHGDIFGGLLFGLGMLLPLVAAWTAGQFVALLWRGLLDRALSDLLLALLAGIASMSALILLTKGEVLQAGAVIGVYWIVRAVVRAVVRWSVRRRTARRRGGHHG